MVTQTSLFQAAIETVEQLSPAEQAQLLDIIYRRLIEQRREHLVKEVAAARRAYQSGQVRRGTVDNLMAELAE